MTLQLGFAKSRWAIMIGVLAATLALSGCGPPNNRTESNGPGRQASTSAPPQAPGGIVPSAGDADTSGVDAPQIDAMFDAAVAQARPSKEKRAICVGMQGLADGAIKDAPERVTQRLGDMLRLPAVPASQCKFGTFPFVTATKANAILYTVKVEARDADDVLTFWATAAFGNLGAHGTQFRLVREHGRWTPKPTGLSSVS